MKIRFLLFYVLTIFYIDKQLNQSNKIFRVMSVSNLNI